MITLSEFVIKLLLIFHFPYVYSVQVLYYSYYDTLMFIEKLESVSQSLEMIQIAELLYCLVQEKCSVLVSLLQLYDILQAFTAYNCGSRS